MKISDFIRGDILSRMIIAGERRQFISGAGYWFYPLPRYLLLFFGFILVSACSSGGGGGGSGGPSGSSSAITVSNLQVVRGSSNDQFTLSWTNPANPPSNITGFEINYAGTHPLVGQGLQVIRADLPAGAFTGNSGENLRAGTNVNITVTVSPLANTIGYSWSVRLLFDNSVDSIRASQPSNRVATTLAPEVVQIFELRATQVNADSIKLQWINPQNSDISSFNLNVNSSGTISTRVLSSPAIRGAAQRVEHVVNGFSSGTYELTLTPILSEDSASLNTHPITRNNVAVVPPAQFSVDMAVTVYQNTPDSIRLEWRNPPYVRIASFNISYSVDGGDDVNVTTSGVTTQAGAPAGYNLDGLSQEGSYSFKVIPIFQTIDAGIMVQNNIVEVNFDPNAVDTDRDGVFGKSDVDADNDGLIDISTLDELSNIRYNLAGSRLAKSSGAFGSGAGCPITGCNGYELLNDIDLDGPANDLRWIAIGDRAHPFTGIFDGKGYQLMNMTILRDTEDTGFFRVASNQIRNVHLLNINITNGPSADTGGFAGGLVGFGEGVSIVNSAVRGGMIDFDIDDDSVFPFSTGGLVGSLAGTGRIESSYVELSLIETLADRTTGGVGGLVGLMNNGDEISSSYAAVGTIQSNATMGGLVGLILNGDRGPTKIDFSYAAVGNLIAHKIKDESLAPSGIAGLIGSAGGFAGLSSSYAIVKEINLIVNPIYNNVVGGLIGRDDTVHFGHALAIGLGRFPFSYYDNSTLNIVNTSAVSINRLGIAKTTEELQNSTSFATGTIYETWADGWCDPQTGSFTRDRNVAISGGYGGDEQRAWDLGTNQQYPTLSCFMGSNKTMQIQSISKILGPSSSP